MYGLTDADRRIRDAAREFADELIPFEVEAELAGGALPDETADAHHEQAIARGLYATNMPALGRAARAARCCSRCSSRNRSAASPTGWPG